MWLMYFMLIGKRTKKPLAIALSEARRESRREPVGVIKQIYNIYIYIYNYITYIFMFKIYIQNEILFSHKEK
jgi:hypothetical protein